MYRRVRRCICVTAISPLGLIALESCGLVVACLSCRERRLIPYGRLVLQPVLRKLGILACGVMQRSGWKVSRASVHLAVGLRGARLHA